MDISTIDKTHFSHAFVNQLSWEMLKDVLSNHGLTRSNSRERTAQGIASAINSKDKVELFESLWDTYQDIVFFGDKAVRFYPISKEMMKPLIAFIQTLQLERNVFTDSFPLPIRDKLLKKHFQKNKISPLPVKVIQMESGAWMLLFSSVRYYTEQESFDQNWLEESKIKILSRYNEIIAKRNIYRQACDFIIIRPDKGVIEVGVDHPDSGGVFSQTLVQKNMAFNFLLEDFNRLTHHLISGQLMLAKPIVLFDAIRNFFESSDGRVFRMRFLTNDGLDDHPNMTNFKTDNYREAKFLKGGKKNVAYLKPYRISMVWNLPSGNMMHFPLLHLQGSKPMLRSSGKRLHEAIISNTIGFHDYEFAVNKLFNKLP